MRNLVIDGSYLARSRYEVGTIPHGVLSKIKQLRRRYNPEITLVAWDSDTHLDARRALTETYKESRSPPPPQYVEMLGELKVEIGKMGVCQVEAKGYEGDDVIATIARTFPGPTAIYSKDKDLLQLISESVTYLRAKEGADLELDAKQLKKTPIAYHGEKMILDGPGWLDLQTLVGDAGDGVRGIPGIGPVRGKKIIDVLEDCGGIAAILSGDLIEHPNSMVAHVLRYRVQLALSRSLVQLYTVELVPV